MYIIYDLNGYIAIEVENEKLYTTLRYEHFDNKRRNEQIEKFFCDMGMLKEQDYDYNSIKNYLVKENIFKNIKQNTCN